MSNGPLFQNQIDAGLNAAVKQIEKKVLEASETKAAMMDAYVRKYMEDHPDQKIEDLTIVEQHVPNGMVFYIAKKSDLGIK